MDGFRLTVEEIRSLRVLHRRCTDRRLADRAKAVILLRTGWTVTETAEVLLPEEDTIRSYRQAYQQGGVDLLLTAREERRSRGRVSGFAFSLALCFRSRSTMEGDDCGRPG
jgi:hypothetical protein